jgi:hypothetical protein
VEIRKKNQNINFKKPVNKIDRELSGLCIEALKSLALGAIVDSVEKEKTLAGSLGEFSPPQLYFSWEFLVECLDWSC